MRAKLPGGGLLWWWRRNIWHDVQDRTPLDSADIVHETIPGFGTVSRLAKQDKKPVEKKEWQGRIVGDSAIVYAGVVPMGTVLIANGAGSDITVDLSGIPASSYRWVCAKIDFTNGTIGTELSTGPDKALSDPDNGIVRRNLFRVYRGPDVDGKPVPCVRSGPTAWEGEIQFDGAIGS